MDRQSMPGGGAGAVQESCYVGAGQAEIAGGAFLLELLEDTPAPADQQPLEVVDDRLSRVMRSLEAEIGSESGPAAAEGNQSTADGLMSDDGGLEDILSNNFEGTPETEAPLLAAMPFEYWEEAPAAVMGNGMGGWYVDGEGILAGYEFREPCYYTYGEGSAVEQVYSPLCLWE